MIVGVGIDMIEVELFHQKLREEPHFISDHFHPEEIEYCEKFQKSAAEHFAGRYTAKRALFKAFQPLDIVPKFSDVWIARKSSGQPQFQFHPSFSLPPSLKFHLSISHTHSHAVAMTTIELEE